MKWKLLAILGLVGYLALVAQWWNDSPGDLATDETNARDASVDAAGLPSQPARRSPASLKHESNTEDSATQGTPRETEPSEDEVVAQEESPPDARGNFSRRKLLRTHMSYPLVRIDDELKRTASGEVRVSHTAYVADHVMVSLSEGKTEADLKKELERMGAQIRGRVPYSNVYLVSFEPKDFSRLDQVVADLKKTGVVAAPERDFLTIAY